MTDDWANDERTQALLRVKQRAAELCAAWPPDMPLPGALVALEVELTVLVMIADRTIDRVADQKLHEAPR